jgi:DNA-binding transcriptional ArsR family regulator
MDALSATFAALADPTRRSILARLAKGEATVNELAAPFAMSLPSVSRHLKVLEKAGLVSKSRSAQWRQCRLEVAPLQSADEWMAPYRAFFESRFDRLEEQLKTMVAEREDRHTHTTELSSPSEASAAKTPPKKLTAKGRAVKGNTGRAPQPKGK